MQLDIDAIFAQLNRHQVDFILIGGMNFLLRHRPVLTFDVDVWIHDVPENCARCESALSALDAEWGRSEDSWGPVRHQPSGWLTAQGMFALLTPFGALDVFRQVAGLESWLDCRSRAQARHTAAGQPFLSLSDADMLACQYALEESRRKLDRIRYLESLR